MTDADLPEPGYTELCGADLTTLEQLADLHGRARGGELSLPQWREAYAQVMANATVDPPEVVDRLIGEARTAWAEAWNRELDLDYGDQGDGAADLVAELSALRKHLSTVRRHLELLQGPPTDEQVVTDLPAHDREARELAAEMPENGRDRYLARVEAEERLHAAWLLDIDGTPRDATGLPVAAVAAHLTVSDPELGEIPVGLPEARARAWLAADDEDRRRAAAVAAAPYSLWDPHGWRMRELQHQLRRGVVTDLLRFAYAHADVSPEARDLVTRWEDGDLRGLLRDFLDSSS